MSGGIELSTVEMCEVDGVRAVVIWNESVLVEISLQTTAHKDAEAG